MEKELRALLSKTLNIDDSKFAELVKTDEDGKLISIEVDEILKLDKERVEKLTKPDEVALKERFNNGLAKGKQESLNLHEKSLKEKYNLKSEKKGVDLVAEIITANTKSNKTDEMTPEKIKVSKTFLDMIESKDGEKQVAINEALEPLNKQIKGFERQSTLSIVNRTANGIIDGLNPRFSEDKVKASNQRNVIIDTLGRLNYKVDGERITMLNDKGEQLDDEHGNPVKFEDRVKGITVDLYDLKESKSRKSGGSEEDDDDKTKKAFKWNGVSPKDQKEYQSLIEKADSLEEKRAIVDAWQKQEYDD
jgi:hypothetical protein